MGTIIYCQKRQSGMDVGDKPSPNSNVEIAMPTIDTGKSEENDTNDRKFEYVDIAPSAPTQQSKQNDDDKRTDMMEGEREGWVVMEIQTEQEKVKQWFKDEVELFEDNDKYFELFMDNGWDKLKTIKHMTNDDLVEIGISKSGHRKAILLAIKEL